MHCRQIDIHDDAEFDRHYQIGVASESFERPYHTPWGLEALKTLVRGGDPAEKTEVWAAFDGTGMVGAGVLQLPLLDNTWTAWLEVNVEPERRRRGIGSAVLEAMVASAAAQGRTVMMAGSAYPPEHRDDHPYRRFADHHGFTLGNTEVHRVLELPVAEATLQGLMAEAAPHHPAYQIRHYVGAIPTELLASYCHVHNQLALDAPTGELEFEEERMTPEVKLERDELMRKAGRTRSAVLAVHEGEVVAYTDLIIPADEPGIVHQWGTLVLRGHRGHRLGLAIKARNLLEVQRRWPDRKRVHTGNAEVNAWMVAINERMGFRPVELFVEFQRKLA